MSVFNCERAGLEQSNCNNIYDREMCANIDDLPSTNTKSDTSFIDKKKQRTSRVQTLKEWFHQKTGYYITTKIATTLQGSVYKAVNKNNEMIIVKRAALSLYDKKIALIEGQYYKVNEDIVRESKIMKYLQDRNPPKKNWIKYIDLFKDDKNLYLLMEYGGINLFQYILKMHSNINDGLLSINEWTKHVRILFKQMSHYINWLHNVCNVTHSDISLENIVIKGYKIKNGKFIKHGYISFIDFGVAQSFSNKINCKSNNFEIGKTKYKSPELQSLKPYNAKLNDCWALGVCLFMMNFGSSPFDNASNNCINFRIIMQGKLKNMLKHINKSKYITRKIINLLNMIFKYENKRYDISDILKSEYLK